MIITNCPKCGSMNITTAGVCSYCGWSQFNKSMVSTDVLLDVATPIDVALRKRIAELEAERRWIPVSERLPELGSPILFYDSILERINKGTCTAKNSDNTNLHWFTDDDLFYFGDRSEYITHWMPLPNPPEVK